MVELQTPAYRAVAIGWLLLDHRLYGLCKQQVDLRRNLGRHIVDCASCRTEPGTEFGQRTKSPCVSRPSWSVRISCRPPFGHGLGSMVAQRLTLKVKSFFGCAAPTWPLRRPPDGLSAASCIVRGCRVDWPAGFPHTSLCILDALLELER